MKDIIKAFTDLLRTITETAGGRKRGQLAFWIVFVVAVLIAAKPAYNSVDYVVSHISEMSTFLTILASFFAVLVAIAVLFAIVAAIAILFGLTVRVGFATPTNIRIDNIFTKLLPLLRNANEQQELDKEGLKTLLAEAEDLYERWNSSRIVRFVHWVKKPKPKRS